MTDAPPPLTVQVPTGWRRRLDPRPGLARLRDSAAAIVQIVVAATGAYVFANMVLGHPAPLLAATVTISSLGLVRDARPRRVLETVLGMLVGILVAELLLIVAGSGWWQLGLALALTLTVARFLSPQASFAIAAAIQSLIVMVSLGAPFLRLVDGIVGGVAALLVTALVPRSTVRVEVRDARRLFTAADGVIATLAYALSRGERLRAERGLEKARAVGSVVDAWRTSLESGAAIARISPFLRRQRDELARHQRICQSVDLATRNLRVVARRVVYLSSDGQPRPVAASILTDLARGMQLIAASLEDISLEPAARESLRAVAVRLDPPRLLPGAGLGEHNLIVAMRPLAVDLLMATGMSSDEAHATIPRI
ncbi:FUSC family protein [Microbacterium terricola]|uniref:FUSC family protein n=1 Tax=Microbacterium terricola TaxID=344163 RepID=A0ABM8E0L1_9MICO|nr:FUSC family protein [Microbacterium terricola]UYK40918.1 FUSC family protein [Microbacterium terricola]BDV31332.1 FUSC family protein [Microbacterium terricola]